MTISGSLFLVCLLRICHVVVLSDTITEATDITLDPAIKIFGDTASTLQVDPDYGVMFENTDDGNTFEIKLWNLPEGTFVFDLSVANSSSSLAETFDSIILDQWDDRYSNFASEIVVQLEALSDDILMTAAIIANNDMTFLWIKYENSTDDDNELIFWADSEWAIAPLEEGDTSDFLAAGNTDEHGGWLFRIDLCKDCYILPNRAGYCHKGLCVCFQGFTGMLCTERTTNACLYVIEDQEEDICLDEVYPPWDNACSIEPCIHGDCLLETNGDYSCNCQLGYEGARCEQNIDECVGVTCHNHGICIDEINSYICHCYPGYAGHECDRLILDPCEPSPCANGECRMTESGSFWCSCQQGFTGDFCETNINDCSSTPCLHGSCHDGVDLYHCTCPPNYTGTNCESLMDDCSAQPCLHGRCTDDGYSYYCECFSGYSGTNCEINIDDCYSSLCEHGHCEDLIAGYRCICQPGYTGRHCEVNINECQSSPCNDGLCQDMVNYFVCECDAGFTGIVCQTDIDECDSDPCMHGDCYDSVNRYSCSCHTGFAGINCEYNSGPCSFCGKGECIRLGHNHLCLCVPGYTGPHCDVKIVLCASNPCVHGTCEEQIDRYLCRCDAGYAGVNCADDIDECEELPCHFGTCGNRPGSFECHCRPGFGGQLCEMQVNDCYSSPCNRGMCIPVFNGYMCSCPPGFTGINCEMEKTNCDSAPCVMGRCMELDNGYRCICDDGFTGEFCQLLVGDCGSSECLNGNCHAVMETDGYICVCHPGFTGMHCDVLIDYCATSPCVHGNCVSKEGGFSCIRCPGYTGVLCEIQINYCESSPCGELGTCRSIVDGYICECVDDVYGSNCEIQKRTADVDVVEKQYTVLLFTMKTVIQILEIEERLRRVIANIVNNYCVSNPARCCSFMPFKSGVISFTPLITSQHVSIARGYPRSVGNGQTEIGIIVRAPLKVFYGSCNAYNDEAKMRPYRQVSGSRNYSQDNMRTELYTNTNKKIYLDRDLLHLIIQENLDNINQEKDLCCLFIKSREKEPSPDSKLNVIFYLLIVTGFLVAGVLLLVGCFAMRRSQSNKLNGLDPGFTELVQPQDDRIIPLPYTMPMASQPLTGPLRALPYTSTSRPL